MREEIKQHERRDKKPVAQKVISQKEKSKREIKELQIPNQSIRNYPRENAIKDFD